MNISLSTEWLKVGALVALVCLNGWSQIRPAPAPLVVVKPDGPTPPAPPDGPPSPPPVSPDVKPSNGYLAFSEAGTYVVRIQVGNQQGAIVANIDAPGSYPVAVTAQPR